VATKAARAGTAAHPSSLRLWQLRLRLEAADSPSSSKKKGKEGQATPPQLMPLVLEALGCVPAAAAGPLWEQVSGTRWHTRPTFICWTGCIYLLQPLPISWGEHVLFVQHPIPVCVAVKHN
jgi:hypothetical protein